MLTNHLLGDYSKLPQCWTSDTCDWSSKFWPLQHTCSPMIVIQMLGKQFTWWLQHPTVTWLVFLIFPVDFPQVSAETITSFSSKSLQAPGTLILLYHLLTVFLHLELTSLSSSATFCACAQPVLGLTKFSFGVPHLIAFASLSRLPSLRWYALEHPYLLTWDFCHFCLNDPYILRLQ